MVLCVGYTHASHRVKALISLYNIVTMTVDETDPLNMTPQTMYETEHCFYIDDAGSSRMKAFQQYLTIS